MISLKKSLALVLSCALAAAVFAGCTQQPALDGDDVLPGADGKPVKVEKIATIGGESITLAQFKSIYPSAKQNFVAQFGGDQVLAVYPDAFGALKDSVLDLIRAERIYEKFAEQNGMLVAEADRPAALDKMIADVKEQVGGEDVYKLALEQSGFTEESYRAMLDNQFYIVLVQDEAQKADGKFAPTTEEIQKEIDTNYQGMLRAKHILLSTQGVEDVDAVTARAEAALTRAKNGEDFDALIKEYGEDPGMQSNPDGYYFREGDMVTEFYEGTMALADNEISNLVKSDFGYHIIQRLPLDEKFYSDIGITLAMAKISDEVTAMIDAATIEKMPEFDLITMEYMEPELAAAASEAAAAASSSEAAAAQSSSVAESTAPESAAPEESSTPASTSSESPAA